MKPAFAPLLPWMLALGAPWGGGVLPTRADTEQPESVFNADANADANARNISRAFAEPPRPSGRPQVFPALDLPNDAWPGPETPRLLALGATPDPSTHPSSSTLRAEEQRLQARMAAEGTNVVDLFSLADVCHDAGVDGDKQAVLRSEAYLRKLLELEPNHSRGLALLGSVYTMKGRDAFWPTTQIRLVKEGNAYMDQAVTLAPDDIPTRTIRALNNAHMPDFLGRTQVVREDLAWLWGKIEKGAAPISTSAKQQLALHWGRILKRQRKVEEAIQVLKAGRGFAPDSTVAAEITAELEKLR
ncbi:MAG: hypothetical protein JNK85_08510 [Verrucomicrobiales bacterium]|nr:hypothetical protein [Verrucomicrobiales bacterium]